MNEQIFKLSDELKELRDTKKYAEQELKEINAQITEVETALIEQMVNLELSAFKRNGQSFSLVIQNYPQAEPEHKDRLYEEFKERGFEHLFTINHQTLTSTLKELITANGDEIPDWLDGLIKFYEKTSIRISKG